MGEGEEGEGEGGEEEGDGGGEVIVPNTKKEPSKTANFSFWDLNSILEM